MKDLVKQALNPDSFNKKAKDRLFEYAFYYGEQSYFSQLSVLKYPPADRWEQEGKEVLKRMLSEYQQDNLKALEPKLIKHGIDFRNELNLSPFILAIWYGATQIAEHLIENGTKTNLTDNFGRNALQLALLKAELDSAFKQKVINKFYGTLKTESIRVKIDNKLLKIDNHQAEFLMLNFMISTLRTKIIAGTTRQNRFENSEIPVYQTQDYLDFYEGLSTHVVADYRKVRSYLSSILSKNEVNRDDKYNKKLFLRIQQGMYLPNPLLEILVGEEWVNIYDLIDMDDIEQNHAKYNKIVFTTIKNYRKSVTG